MRDKGFVMITLGLALATIVVTTLAGLFAALECTGDTTAIEQGSPADAACDVIDGQAFPGLGLLVIWGLPVALVVAGSFRTRRDGLLRWRIGGMAAAAGWVLLLGSFPSVLPAN